ncbi:uncharacterized protein LOC135622700 isoform X1 [Musa acuminata AAA Group]|uniref:uncharacterized protein LOC103997167 isoform X1 n=2 Tax=Musa acuminata AAA Group TaxID=214697 RepID=UPI0031CE96E9
MCGRTRCTLNTDQIARACGLTVNAASIRTHEIDRYRPSYNVSPGAYLPVVLVERATGEAEESPAIRCMKWGLVPSFTKKTEKPDHYKMFNARSESIKEKASFRRLVPTNRCLVAVEGFYEWKKDGSKKQPYYIHFKDNRPLVFAALYDAWKNSEGDILYTLTILTTSSSSALQWLHDRMPVILRNEGSVDVWLNKAIPEFETVLRPYEDADLVWYPVTTAVGKPSFDGPECIKEIQLSSADRNPISKFFAKKTDDKDQMEVKHGKSLKESPKQEIFDIAAELSISSEESPQGDHFDDLKEHLEFNTHANADDESDHFSLLKNPSIEPEICGTKRGSGAIAPDSGLTSEKGSKPKKKARPVKNTGDKQASLLSYFEKA